MTTDSANDQAGGTPEILTQEELNAAVEKELGEPVGYLDLKYREWCLQRPDEVFNYIFQNIIILYCIPQLEIEKIIFCVNYTTSFL